MTNQHCLRGLNRRSRDEHIKQLMRNDAAALRADCEDPVAMCEPGHQEQERVDTEIDIPRRRRRFRPLRDASDQHTIPARRVRHLIGAKLAN